MRVLLCEDELLITMMLEDTLTDLGHELAGVATTADSALALLRDVLPDFAVVDFQLADGACYDVIAALKLLRVPFVLVTGSHIDTTDPRLSSIPVLAKPVHLDELSAIFDRACSTARGPTIDPESAPRPAALDAVEG